jgi:hypothetical protein
MDQMGASYQFVGSYAALDFEAVCHETAQWAISGDFGSIVLCLQELFLSFLHPITSRNPLVTDDGPGGRVK